MRIDTQVKHTHIYAIPGFNSSRKRHNFYLPPETGCFEQTMSLSRAASLSEIRAWEVVEQVTGKRYDLDRLEWFLRRVIGTSYRAVGDVISSLHASKLVVIHPPESADDLVETVELTDVGRSVADWFLETMAWEPDDGETNGDA